MELLQDQFCSAETNQIDSDLQNILERMTTLSKSENSKVRQLINACRKDERTCN